MSVLWFLVMNKEPVELVNENFSGRTELQQ